MKIHEYNEMMRYLTRRPETLSKVEKKKIVKDFYKKAEQPKSKPMEITKYISRINELYGNGKTDEYGNPETATTRINDPEFFQKKLPKKIAKKPKPLFPSSAEELMAIQDWLNVIDPNWLDEFEPNPDDDDKTRLKKEIIRTGITTLI